MTEKETIQVITLLAGNYDSIANKSKDQKRLMIQTWKECLKDLEYSTVLEAVKMSIISSPYPPTIHDIRKYALELISPISEQQSALEAWNEAYNMICNGLYMTEEEFDRHSENVKKFFGNLKQVRELALTDIKTVNTVVKGQFLKQYEIIQERNYKQRMVGNLEQTKLIEENKKQLKDKE